MDDEHEEQVASTAAASAPDFRAELFLRLQSKGFLDALKSQLRRHLINELTGSGRKLKGSDGILSSTASAATLEAAAKKPLSLKITNSLIVQHLEACEYDYTMSVFLPECGMTAKEVLTTEEVGHYIRLDLYGLSADKLMTESRQSVLWKMLSAIPDRKSALDCGTQTDKVAMLAGVVGFIDQKLSAIDEHYNAKEDSSRKSSSLQIEERLLGYQRQTDKMAAEHIAREIERFRSTEQSHIRAEEQQRFQQELEKCRKEMEASYSQKLVALQERERVAFDKLQKDYELMGHETYRQRQQLLKQIEELRVREADLRRQQENSSRESKLAEDRLKKMDEMLHSREASLVQKEKEYDMHLKLVSDRIRSEEKDKYEARHRELQEMHLKLKEEEQNLRLHRERLLSSGERQELVEKRQHILQLESLVTKYTHELSAADANVRQLQDRLRQTVDYDVLRDTNLTLRSELDHVKQRLAEVQKDNEKLRERHEQLVKDFSQKGNTGMSSSDLITFRIEMERLKDMAVQDKIIAEARLADALAKLHSQMEKNHALVLEYEKQTDSLRGMSRLLAQSQQSVDLDVKEPRADSKVTSAAVAEGRARPAKPRGYRNMSTADVAVVEQQLGSAWVPYPTDAARCFATDHHRHRFGMAGLHRLSTCAGDDTAVSQKRGYYRINPSSPDNDQAHGDRPHHASVRNTAAAAPTAISADFGHSTSSDNTACDSLVEDTRRRLHGLETEAERLQLALQSFGTSTALSPCKADYRHGIECSRYFTANAVLPCEANAASPSNLGHEASSTDQLSAFRRYQRETVDSHLFDRPTNSDGVINPSSSALVRKPDVDSHAAGSSWDAEHPRLPTVDDAGKRDGLQLGGAWPVHGDTERYSGLEPVREVVPSSGNVYGSWRNDPQASSNDVLPVNALRKEGRPQRDADVQGERASTAAAKILKNDHSEHEGPSVVTGRPPASTTNEAERNALPADDWGRNASPAGRRRSGGGDSSSSSSGSVGNGRRSSVVGGTDSPEQTVPLASRAGEIEYHDANDSRSNHGDKSTGSKMQPVVASAAAAVAEGTAAAAVLFNQPQQQFVAFSRLHSPPKLEVSLDNEWRMTSRPTNTGSDDVGRSSSSSIPQAQQLTSAAVPSRQTGSDRESHDNADRRPADSSAGVRLGVAASPSSEIKQLSPPDEKEGTGMSDAMEKYMQMMQQQPAATRQQQRQNDEEEDGGDGITPSMSIDESESTNRTDEDQDRSDNFW